MKEEPPARRQLGDADDIDWAEQRACVAEPPQRGCDEVHGPHHGWRQGCEHGFFKFRNGRQPGMLISARLQVETGAPSLVQGFGGGVDHAGQRLDAVQVTEHEPGQHPLDCQPKRVTVDGTGQASCQPGGKLVEGHDLTAVAALPRGFEPKLPHRLTAVDDNGVPHGIHDVRRPKKRCKDPAASFAL